jgi:hypothetical protein
LTDEKILKKRFLYHHSTRNQSDIYNELALFFYNFAKIIDEHCPDGREKSLAFTRLEETEFWAIGSIARDDEIAELNEPKDDVEVIEIAGVGKVKKKGKEK